ncbi:uncharacterized protein BKA78DRAFT_64274 [Phyllosticta capitalensis]|uniref:uncharacterized protein n=1 Tax=Phyllosticta capitalensis TaxID=121624 RepID=UPI0031327145
MARARLAGMDREERCYNSGDGPLPHGRASGQPASPLRQVGAMRGNNSHRRARASAWENRDLLGVQ